MRAPINCPICGDPLLNTFPPAEDLSDKLTKSCNRRTTHAIAMAVEGDEVMSLSIGINTTHKLQATWLFNKQEILVWEENSRSIPTNIPYFEPDLSNYRKLVDKIKTYIVFS
jgi:hypothetical protein